MNRWEEDDTFLARWLNNELTKEELDSFEGSPEWEEYSSLMQATEQLRSPQYNTTEGLDRLRQGIQQTKKVKRPIRRTRAIVWSIAASVALIMVAFFFFSSDEVTVKTIDGQQEIVYLPDGSEVRLNANSSLSYNPKTWESQRDIRMKGEAFFQVKKGSRFAVKSPSGTVTVLGTSFNIRDRSSYSVDCYTGKVAVEISDYSTELSANEGLVVRDNGLPKKVQEQLPDGPSWLTGITILKEVKFPEALEELKSIFALQVTYDGSLDDLTYDGAFPHENPEAAIKLVLDPLNIRYTFDSQSKSLVILGFNK